MTLKDRIDAICEAICKDRGCNMARSRSILAGELKVSPATVWRFRNSKEVQPHKLNEIIELEVKYSLR